MAYLVVRQNRGECDLVDLGDRSIYRFLILKYCFIVFEF